KNRATRTNYERQYCRDKAHRNRCNKQSLIGCHLNDICQYTRQTSITQSINDYVHSDREENNCPRSSLKYLLRVNSRTSLSHNHKENSRKPKIGRASCREREQNRVLEGAL